MELMSISSMTPSIGLTFRLEFPLQIYEAQTPNYIVTCDYATGMRLCQCDERTELLASLKLKTKNRNDDDIIMEKTLDPDIIR